MSGKGSLLQRVLARDWASFLPNQKDKTGTAIEQWSKWGPTQGSHDAPGSYHSYAPFIFIGSALVALTGVGRMLVFGKGKEAK